MQNIELLAPAGDDICLRAAIANGANAVYLGLQEFNARMRAENFTVHNIGPVVDYAHEHGVKVYMTVNTLIRNNEIKRLMDTVAAAVKAGVDAYLVQDFGTLAILKKCFPGINIHASTQMGIHNLYGAQMAEKMGITRVVLSRETKLEDIIQIRKHTNLELEYFVQGALCVAFSGNCYLSSILKNSSGNRGMCKQFCRMAYTTDPQNPDYHYYLSPRDLCLVDNLRTLIDAGITSFKIEGRLRRAGYVGQAVHTYRCALDNILKDTPFDREEHLFALRRVFSRGDFNYDAYLKPGVPDNIINYHTQNHLGVPIGTVLSVEPFKDLSKVVIHSPKHVLHLGDGLKMLDNNIQIVSLGVGNVDDLGNHKYAIYTKHKLKPGYKVNLIVDVDAENVNVVKQVYVPIQMSIRAMPGENLSCTLSGRGVTVNYVDKLIVDQARKSPTSQKEIIEQFSKLGGTPYAIEKIEVETDNAFITKSNLNNARREALYKLTLGIINKYRPPVEIDKDAMEELYYTRFPCCYPKPRRNIVVVDEFTQIPELSPNDILSIAPTVYDQKTVSKWLSTAPENCKKALLLPIVANSLDLAILDKIIDANPELILIINNIYGLKYLEKNRTIIAGIGMNVYNNFARRHLMEMGVEYCVASIEQSLYKLFLMETDYVHSLGRIPVMTFCHCPHKAVNSTTCAQCNYKDMSYTDQQGNTYPIRRYRISQCYFELLHCEPVYNLDKHHFNGYLDLRGLNITDLNNIQLDSYIRGRPMQDGEEQG
ncbi:MAG: U32 family peptidase [Clostridia bacterium]|nr:U32 family peptidase [Clostridia bacterium]